MTPELLLSEIEAAFQTDSASVQPFCFSTLGEGALPSWFRVTDLAAASIGTAGCMLARFMAPEGRERPAVTVDRRLASLWFGQSLHPLGWELPPVWDAIASVYKTRDGWIRLHTNAPHHRRAALSVLQTPGERGAVADAVSQWDGETLEAAVVDAGGCAAMLRSLEAWARHPQGAAVAAEPLVIWDAHVSAASPPLARRAAQAPLADVRVLDLTRVLAGPIATRFLAGFGADVLRLDPPDWEEPAVVPETTLGKRCAGLDLRRREDWRAFETLLAEADVLVHGYRPGALDGLGFDPASRRALNPALIDVSLNAYGWSGPWSGRRGFDSLVQMSSGIADFGMRQSGSGKPLPLPVQALDHATGYLMAAAVLHGLAERRRGRVLRARLSLARTAHLLAATRRASLEGGFPPQSGGDLDPNLEETAWGPAKRVRCPIVIEGAVPGWAYPARHLRTDPAVWREPR